MSSSSSATEPLISPFIRGLVQSLTAARSWHTRDTVGTSFKWSIEHGATGVVLGGGEDNGVVSTVCVAPPRGFPYIPLTLDERTLLMQTLLGMTPPPGQLAKAHLDQRDKDRKDHEARVAMEALGQPTPTTSL